MQTHAAAEQLGDERGGLLTDSGREVLLVAAVEGREFERAVQLPVGVPVSARQLVHEVPLRFLGLGHRGVPNPPLVLQLDGADHHRVAAGVELGKRLIFRHPAAEDVVGQDLLALVVVHLDGDVFAERRQRHRRIALEIVHLVGPVLKGGVVGDPGLERDGGVRRFTRNLLWPAGIAALVPGRDLGGARQRAAFAEAGNRLAVDSDLKPVSAVGVEPRRVDGELGHRLSTFGWRSGLRGRQTRLLADLDDDEFGRLDGREAHHDVDDAGVDVGLGGRLAITLDEERLVRCCALERTRRKSVIMNEPMVSRSCDHSGSSLGSNTAHWML